MLIKSISQLAVIPRVGYSINNNTEDRLVDQQLVIATTLLSKQLYDHISQPYLSIIRVI